MTKHEETRARQLYRRGGWNPTQLSKKFGTTLGEMHAVLQIQEQPTLFSEDGTPDPATLKAEKNRIQTRIRQIKAKIDRTTCPMCRDTLWDDIKTLEQQKEGL